MRNFSVVTLDMTALQPTRNGLLILTLGLLLLALPSAVVLRAGDAPTTKPAASAPATTRSAAADKERKKQEEIDRVMKFFQDTQPDVYDQALTLRSTDQKQFENLIQGAGGTVRRLEDLKKRSPQLFDLTMEDLKLNYKSLRMARELHKPDLAPADKDRLVHDLQKLVSDQFDIRQKIRQFEIDEQAARLKNLDQQLKDRASKKDELIKKRVDDLNARIPRLDW